MKAVFIVLNNVSYLNDILEKFLEINVKGATILDSQGMAAKLAQDKEFSSSIGFNAFSKFLSPDDKPFSKTIFTVVKDEKVEEIVTAIKKLQQSAEEGPFGFIFSMPVSEMFILKND